MKRKQIAVSRNRLVHEFWLGLFWIYVLVLLSQTILPLWQCGFCDGRFYVQIRRYPNGEINMIPFRTIYMFLFGAEQMDEWKMVSYTNLIANVLMFLPVGILLPAAYKKNGKAVFLSGMLLSVFIEILQILVGRSSDIDDVILNSIGAVLGFIVYRTANKCADRFLKEKSEI